MFKKLEKKGEPVVKKKFIHGFEEPTVEEQIDKLKNQLLKMKIEKQDSVTYGNNNSSVVANTTQVMRFKFFNQSGK